MPNFYLDAPNLETATAVYTDAGLSNCAPAGYYSDGSVVRKLVNNGVQCYLEAVQVCESCAEPCGGSINANGGQGIYRLELNVGGTPTDVGAMIIQMNPQSVPDGVLVEYDGVIYNKGVRADGDTVQNIQGNGFRNAGGLAQSQNANNYTIVGNDGSSCGVSSGLIGSGNLDVFNYVNGAFLPTGNQEAYTLSLDDLVLQQGGTSIIRNFVVVVPKASASPETLLVKTIGACGGTAFNLAVSCPTSLPSFAANTTPVSGSTQACDVTFDGVLYAVGTATFPNAAPTTTPQIRDQVFLDSNGANPVANGWYAYNNGPTRFAFKTDAGVVIDLVNCTA